jgi:hypothetical protein
MLAAEHVVYFLYELNPDDKTLQRQEWLILDRDQGTMNSAQPLKRFKRKNMMDTEYEVIVEEASR